MSNLAKSSIIYTIGNVLPQIIGFAFLPIYSRAMSVEDFGIVSSMEVLSSIIAIFMSVSLDRASQRLYFSKEINKKELLSTLYYTSIVCALFMFLILYLFRFYLEMIYSNISYNPYIMLCIITTFFNVFSLIPSIYYQLANKPKLFILFKLGKFISQIGLIIGFVVIYEQGALGQLYALLITSIIFIPISLFVAIKNFGFSFKFSLLKEALQYSWPFMPTLLISWVLNMSDRVFIENYLGMEDLGIYSMAYKISMVFSVFTSSFAMAFIPYFHRLAEVGDKSKAELKKNINYAILGYIFLFFSACFLSKDVVNVFLSDSYSKSINIIIILLTAHLFSAIMGISSVLYILQSKRSKLNLQVAMLSAVINVILNFILIPKFGIYGAAIATLLSMLILNVIQYEKSKTCFFIPLNWYLYITLIFSLLIFIWLINNVISNSDLWILLIKVIVILVITLFILRKVYSSKKVLK